jgi:hypothetical protein
MTVSDDESDVSSDSPVIFSDEPSNDSLNSSVANNDTDGDDSDDSDSDNDDDRLFEDQEHPQNATWPRPRIWISPSCGCGGTAIKLGRSSKIPKIFGRGTVDSPNVTRSSASMH